MSANEVLVTFFTTKTQIATGGITIPIMTVRVIMIPNQMGSYPSFTTAGKKIGVDKHHEGEIVDEGAADKVDQTDDGHDHPVGERAG